jgi:proteasome accessory factor A
LGDKIDWVAKRQIVEQYMAEEGLDWHDDALHSIDLEYHNIDPEKSLFYAYQDMGQTTRVLDEVDIDTAMTDPPQNTRAKGRAKLVESVLGRKGSRFYMFDWNGVALDRHRFIDMSDPFETYESPGDQWQISVK